VEVTEKACYAGTMDRRTARRVEMRVAIADDDSEIIDFWVESSRQICLCGLRGCTSFQTHYCGIVIDLVILDWNMPGKNWHAKLDVDGGRGR